MLNSLLVAPANARPAPTRVVIPIVDFVVGAPVVEVRLNGGPIHRFKFDSGSMELMDARSAASENIRPTGVTKLLEINRAEMMPVSDTDLQLGELDAGTVSLALMPDSGWNHPPAVEGIVGKTLLLRYVVTMDLVAREMIVTSPDAYEPPEDALILPMSELHGLFHVPATVGGAAGEFGIDTGLTSHVILFPGFAQAHASPSWRQALSARDAAGTSGQKTRINALRVDSLILGNAVVAGPEVLLLGDQQGVGRFDEMAGLIGMPALANFTITFDAPHKRLILTPPRKVSMEGVGSALEPAGSDPPF